MASSANQPASAAATVGPTPSTSSNRSGCSAATCRRNAPTRRSQSVARRDLGREPAREVDRGRLADLRDAEAVEHARERPPARLLDRPVEVLGALAREPVERLEVLDGQPEEVGPAADDAALEQLLEDRPAGALDVHPAAADEVAELLADSRAGQRGFGQ